MSAQLQPLRSWELKTWPTDVWPHNGKKGAWLARAYRTELVRAGALSRVGQKIIFIGCNYEKWIASRSANVAEFIPRNPNLGKRSPAGFRVTEESDWWRGLSIEDRQYWKHASAAESVNDIFKFYYEMRYGSTLA